jgi:hypothetical protein
MLFDSKIFLAFKSKVFIPILLLLALMISNDLSAQKQNQKEEKEKKAKKEKVSFRDPEDGAFDLSSYLLDYSGLMPVPFIITEPAVGYGGGAGVLFFKPQKKKYDIRVPPNISGVFGLGTQNKTWFAGLFHFHVFGRDKIRYLGAVGKPNIHINYYGNNNEFLSNNPVNLHLNSWFVLQRAMVRIKKSNLFMGGSYIFFTSDNSVDTLAGKPLINKILNKLDGRSTISMLKPAIKWDSRNYIFSPTKGINTGVTLAYSGTWLGSDNDYETLNTYFLGYQPITPKIFSDWRFDGNYMFGDAPLYALPFLQMRGVPAMKYQSNNTMLVESQWNFVVYKRWKLDVFGGTGKAFETFSDFGSPEWVYNYGVGFRYKLAKAMGMDAGVDFAWSNDGDFAFYITFGTAWNK